MLRNVATRRRIRMTRRAYRRAVLVACVVLPVLAISLGGFVRFWPEPSVLTPADGIEHPPSDLFARPPLTNDITIATPRSAQRRRERLQRFVFGHSGIPDGLPVVERGVNDPKFAAGLTNLERIDRLTISLPFGFTSVAYHLLPRRANRRLVIYHNGHHEEFLAGKNTVAHFLERGYALLVFAMPFAGYNTNPATAGTRCGRVELAPAGHHTTHDSLACLAQPLRFFLEPVAVGLNYTSGLDYVQTAMVGFSGGAWTTMVYAALDPRVQRSYPVAGTRPFYITARWCAGDTPETVPRCFGDIEQRLPSFYRIANHLELYTLASFGRGRRQMAITNVYDACCFSGREYLEWQPLVDAAVRRLGSGAYGAVGDTTHRQHIVSPFALRVIESDLDGG